MPLVATDYTLDGAEKPWAPPCSVTVEQHRLAHNTLQQLDQQILPASLEWISGRIATLLAHFYVADTDPMFNRAVAQDWLKAMGGLPQQALGAACEKWLVERTTKPKPAEIRAMAVAIVGKAWTWQERLRMVVEVPTRRDSKAHDQPRAAAFGSREHHEEASRIGDILAAAGISRLP